MSTVELLTPAGVWSARVDPLDAPKDGEALLLVHGSMDRSAGLLKLSRRLDTDRTVVRYDRRGYGRSVDVGPPFDLPSQVDDLADVIEVHALATPVTLVGHSFGGNVAFAFADRHPERVARIVVYETPLPWTDWWPSDSAGRRALGVDDPADAAEAFMRRLIGDARWERLPSATRAARRAEGTALLAEMAAIQGVAPWDADRVTMPVLAIAGEHGRPHHQQSVRHLESVLADCRVEILPGAGHPGPNTHPDAVADLIRGFVSATSIDS